MSKNLYFTAGLSVLGAVAVIYATRKFMRKSRTKRPKMKLYWYDNFRSKRCEWLLAGELSYLLQLHSYFPLSSDIFNQGNTDQSRMALSLDDKLLGEKVDNYCSSSSEDEGSDDESDDKTSARAPEFIPESNIPEYNGTCTMTGPKGVINDWREFKRLEAEQRESQEYEKQQLMKKLQTTCRSHLNDEEEKKKDDEFMEMLEGLEDEFLKEYRRKRLEEMRKAFESVPKFGKVISLSKDDFLDAIDKEQKNVKVIIHLYEEDVEACEAMNGCIACLAKEYPNVKFCKIKASEAKLSKSFSNRGVPALVFYKNGELIGNYIRLSDELGDDFYATDVESFLQEHGVLPMTEVKVIRDQNTGEVRGILPEDDFDVD